MARHQTDRFPHVAQVAEHCQGKELQSRTEVTGLSPVAGFSLFPILCLYTQYAAHSMG